MFRPRERDLHEHQAATGHQSKIIQKIFKSNLWHLTSCSWSMQIVETVVRSTLHISCLLIFKVKVLLIYLEKNMYRCVMHYLFHRVRSSLYTIFFVNIFFVGLFFPFPFPFFLFTSFLAAGTTKILMFDLAVAFDSAIYNWPCENTGSGKYTPTLGIVCLCALLTVIAKLSQIGDCFA